MKASEIYKQKLRIMSLIMLASMLLSTLVYAQSGEAGSVVVWPLTTKNGVSGEEVYSIIGAVAVEVERYSEMKMLAEGEIEKNVSGDRECKSEDMACLVESASKLGASEVICGDVGRVDGVWLLNLRRIDVRRAAAVAGTGHQLEGEISSLLRSIPHVVARLYGKKAIQAVPSWSGVGKIDRNIPEDVGDEAIKPIRLAALDLTANGVPEELARTITNIAVNQIGAIGVFDIMSREEIGRILEHMEDRQRAGCEDDKDCLVRIGSALKADKLVAGSIGLLGETYVMTLQLIDVEKTQVENRVETTIEKDDPRMIEKAKSAARQLVRKLAEERSGQLKLVCSEEGADVYLDNRLIGTTPMNLTVLPGGWRNLRISKQGFIDWARDIRIRPRETLKQEAELKPSAKFFREYEEHNRTWRILAWTFTGIGAASLGAAVGLHIWNNDRYDNDYAPRRDAYEADPHNAPPGERDSVNELGDEIEDVGYAWASLYALAGVSTGLALYFWISGDDPDRFGELTEASGGKPRAKLDLDFGIDPISKAALIGGRIEF